jgi:YHS domain-containing protein
MILIRLIITIALFYLIYRVIVTFLAHKENQEPKVTSRNAGLAQEDLLEDPHCHTYIPQSQAVQDTIDGKIIYFCSRRCCEEYKESLRNRGQTV